MADSFLYLSLVIFSSPSFQRSTFKGRWTERTEYEERTLTAFERTDISHLSESFWRRNVKWEGGAEPRVKRAGGGRRGGWSVIQEHSFTTLEYNGRLSVHLLHKRRMPIRRRSDGVVYQRMRRLPAGGGGGVGRGGGRAVFPLRTRDSHTGFVSRTNSVAKNAHYLRGAAPVRITLSVCARVRECVSVVMLHSAYSECLWHQKCFEKAGGHQEPGNVVYGVRPKYKVGTTRKKRANRRPPA